MTASELIGILTSRLTYESAGEWDVIDDSAPRQPRIEFIRDENEIQNAILQSLKAKGELEPLYNEILSKQALLASLPQSVIKKIKRILYPETKTTPKNNESISCLIKYFCDKKSKKVGYARAELQFRYHAQSYADQKRILHAFLLHGTKDDRKWAAKTLYEKWDKSFSKEIVSIWEEYHELSVGITLLKFVDKAYCITQIEELRNVGIDDRYIFARLGNEPGFPYEINFETLPPFDYYYVMAKLGRPVDEDLARDILFKKLSLAAKIVSGSSSEEDNFIYRYPSNSITAFKGIDILIWSFGKLGLTTPLIEVFQLAQKAHDSNAEDYKEYAKILFSLCHGHYPEYEDLEQETLFSDEKEEDLPYIDLNDPAIPENVREFIKDLEGEMSDDSDEFGLNIRTATEK